VERGAVAPIAPRAGQMNASHLRIAPHSNAEKIAALLKRKRVLSKRS
jgi:hypothetical protein